MKINSISEIQSLKYEGYLWMSNMQKPEIYTDKELELPTKANPFIVEGQLYNKDKGLSYSIKYVDGEYVIHEHKVTKADIDNPDNEIKEYLSNRMDNRWLKFLRYWEKVEDKNCNDKFVLKLTKNVFIGFKEEKEERK